MDNVLDAALANPWGALDAVLDGPLHPGGTAATTRLLDRVGTDSGTRVLDVGCGAGDALTVARERGADAVGVDLDPSQTTDGVVRGDATALPVADGSVDVLLAECVLCLADLPTALGEAHRVLGSDGWIALSDVVVDGELPAVPESLAEALCLTGARSHSRLLAELSDAGFDVQSTHDHHDELLAMRDQLTERVDYQGLLGLMGERGRRVLDAVEALEAAVESGRIGYVSILATA